MPRNGTKKITPEIYADIKLRLKSNKPEEVAFDTGYSINTIEAINSHTGYDAWRGHRRRVAKKAERPLSTNSADTGLKSTPAQTVLPQSVEIKSPGHGRDFTLPKQTPAPTYVTRQEFEQTVRNLLSAIKAASKKAEDLEGVVEDLAKEDTAYKVAMIDAPSPRVALSSRFKSAARGAVRIVRRHR